MADPETTGCRWYVRRRGTTGHCQLILTQGPSSPWKDNNLGQLNDGTVGTHFFDRQIYGLLEGADYAVTITLKRVVATSGKLTVVIGSANKFIEVSIKNQEEVVVTDILTASLNGEILYSVTSNNPNYYVDSIDAVCVQSTLFEGFDPLDPESPPISGGQQSSSSSSSASVLAIPEECEFVPFEESSSSSVSPVDPIVLDVYTQNISGYSSIGVSNVYAFSKNTIYRMNDGSVWGSGDNSSGQLVNSEDPLTPDIFSTVVELNLDTLSDFDEIYIGKGDNDTSYSTILKDGKVYTRSKYGTKQLGRLQENEDIFSIVKLPEQGVQQGIIATGKYSTLIYDISGRMQYAGNILNSMKNGSSYNNAPFFLVEDDYNIDVTNMQLTDTGAYVLGVSGELYNIFSDTITKVISGGVVDITTSGNDIVITMNNGTVLTEGKNDDFVSVFNTPVYEDIKLIATTSRLNLFLLGTTLTYSGILPKYNMSYRGPYKTIGTVSGYETANSKMVTNGTIADVTHFGVSGNEAKFIVYVKDGELYMTWNKMTRDSDINSTNYFLLSETSINKVYKLWNSPVELTNFVKYPNRYLDYGTSASVMSLSGASNKITEVFLSKDIVVRREDGQYLKGTDVLDEVFYRQPHDKYVKGTNYEAFIRNGELYLSGTLGVPDGENYFILVNSFDKTGLHGETFIDIDGNDNYFVVLADSGNVYTTGPSIFNYADSNPNIFKFIGHTTSSASKIVVGYRVCYVLGNGVVYGAGLNSDGCLGQTVPNNDISDGFVVINGFTNITDISVTAYSGNYTTALAALSDDGKLYGIGAIRYLGGGAIDDTVNIGTYFGVDDVSSIGTGDRFIIIQKNSGALFMAGSAPYGVGLSRPQDFRATFEEIVGVTDVTDFYVKFENVIYKFSDDSIKGVGQKFGRTIRYLTYKQYKTDYDIYGNINKLFVYGNEIFISTLDGFLFYIDVTTASCIKYNFTGSVKQMSIQSKDDFRILLNNGDFYGRNTTLPTGKPYIVQVVSVPANTELSWSIHVVEGNGPVIRVGSSLHGGNIREIGITKNGITTGTLNTGAYTTIYFGIYNNSVNTTLGLEHAKLFLGETVFTTNSDFNDGSTGWASYLLNTSTPTDRVVTNGQIRIVGVGSTISIITTGVTKLVNQDGFYYRGYIKSGTYYSTTSNTISGVLDIQYPVVLYTNGTVRQINQYGALEYNDTSSLTNVSKITATLSGKLYAIKSDGTVWTWRNIIPFFAGATEWFQYYSPSSYKRKTSIPYNLYKEVVPVALIGENAYLYRSVSSLNTTNGYLEEWTLNSYVYYVTNANSVNIVKSRFVLMYKANGISYGYYVLLNKPVVNATLNSTDFTKIRNAFIAEVNPVNTINLYAFSTEQTQYYPFQLAENALNSVQDTLDNSYMYTDMFFKGTNNGLVQYHTRLLSTQLAINNDLATKAPFIFNNLESVVGGDGYTIAVSGSTVFIAGNTDITVNNYLENDVIKTAITDVSKIYSGDKHVIAQISGVNYYAWGKNDRGQLGINSLQDQTSPVLLPVSNVSEIFVGNSHNFIIDSNKRVYAWGDNTYGQLGIPNTSFVSVVTAIPEIYQTSDYISIHAGRNNSFFFKNDGSILVCGDNTYKQLGVMDANNALTPVYSLTKDISNVKKVDALHEHVLCLLSTGEVYGWGRNDKGQLGVGHTIDKNVPQLVGINDIQDIGTGEDFSVALNSSGGVFTWGSIEFNDVLNSNTGTVADFSNADANVDQNVNGWGLLVNDDKLLGIGTLGNGVITTGTSAPGGTARVWILTPYAGLGPNGYFDGLDQTYGQIGGDANGVYDKMVVDLLTAQHVPNWSRANSGSSYTMDIRGCNDWNGTTGTWSSILCTLSSGGTSSVNNINTTPYRFYKLSGLADWYMGTISANGIASTNNTFQYRVVTSGIVKVYSLPTISLLDETNTQLVNGDILLQYSTDGSTWSSQYSLNDFKALGNITSDTFWLRFQMVGDNRLKQVTIQTPSSYITSINVFNNHFFIQRDGKTYGVGKEPIVGLEETSDVISDAGNVYIYDIGLESIEYIKGRYNTGIAKNSSGNYFAWGDDQYGQIIKVENEYFPKMPYIRTNFTDLSIGEKHIVELNSDGNVYSWGSTDYGQLGVGILGVSGTSEEFQKLKVSENDGVLTDMQVLDVKRTDILYAPEITYLHEKSISGAYATDVVAGNRTSIFHAIDSKFYTHGLNTFGQHIGVLPTSLGSIFDYEISVMKDLILYENGDDVNISNKELVDVEITEDYLCGIISGGELYSMGNSNSYNQLGSDVTKRQLVLGKLFTQEQVSKIDLTTSVSLSGGELTDDYTIVIRNPNHTIVKKWSSSTAYKSGDIVRPTVDNGFVYTILKIANGYGDYDSSTLQTDTEPTWPIQDGGSIQIGQIGWEPVFSWIAIKFETFLNTRETIIPIDWGMSRVVNGFSIHSDGNVYDDIDFEELTIEMYASDTSDLIENAKMLVKTQIKNIRRKNTLFFDIKNQYRYHWIKILDYRSQYYKLEFYERDLNIELEFDQVKLGLFHGVAKTKDGKVYTWGNNIYGQLGVTLDDSENGSCILTSVSGVGNVTKVHASPHAQTFVINSNKELLGWGYNKNYELGLGHNSNRSIPGIINVNNQGVIDVASAYSSTYAITEDNVLWVWGDNHDGLLGTGDYKSKKTPFAIMSNVEKVYACPSNVAMIKTDGSLWIWGYNIYGQIGDGTTDDSLVPVQISLTNVVSFAFGKGSSHAVLNNGTMWSWGNINYDAIGSDEIYKTNISSALKSLSGSEYIDYDKNGSIYLSRPQSYSVPKQVFNVDFRDYTPVGWRKSLVSRLRNKGFEVEYITDSNNEIVFSKNYIENFIDIG